MNDVKKRVQENYEAFHLMTLSVAFLNSAAFGDFDGDAGKVIAFIGKSYGLDDVTISTFSNLILGDMMKIGLISDYHALSSFDNLSDSDRSKLVFYEIKGRALEEVNYSDRRDYFYANPRLNQNMKAGMKYESFHHIYAPFLRFENLKQQAFYGDLNSTRQLAILYALGIGTKKDTGKAKMHLKRCVMWGDIASAVLLKEICSEGKDEEGSREFGELYRLEKEYLKDGVIRLPEREQATAAVRELYLCIALIKQYIVIQGRKEEIDIAFLDALLQPGLPLKVKLNYISQYKEFVWKNSVCGKEEKNQIGLRGKCHE